MRFKKYIVGIAILIIVASSSYLVKLSFDEIVFGDVDENYLSDLDKKIEPTYEKSNFLNESQVFEYYDDTFDQLKIIAEDETNEIVKNINDRYDSLSEDEKESTLKKTTIISEFVLEAKRTEQVINDLVALYLDNLKHDLIAIGYDNQQAQKIIKGYHDKYLIHWQRNLIIDALENK